MDYINFEKGSGREYPTTKQINEILNNRQEQKNNDFTKRKRDKATYSYTSNNWTLPNLCDNVSKHKKKKKRRHSETSDDSNDSKYHLKRRDSRKQENKGSKHSSSEVDSSSNEEDRPTLSKKKRHKKMKKSNKKLPSRDRDPLGSVDHEPKPQSRDKWMEFDSLFPTYKKRDTKKSEKEVSSITAKPGQSSRELNPYWKDGGSGLPSFEKDYDIKSSVGDKGLEWYERALKRAQETAIEEGRSLAEVVSDRWGSLEALTELIKRAKAEKTPRNRFQRPGDEFGRSTCILNKDKKWRKSSHKETNESSRNERVAKDNISVPGLKDQTTQCTSTSTETHAGVAQEEPKKALNDDELNSLAAKLVKAEILGNTNRANKLKQALAAARAARQAAIDAAVADVSVGEETVVLVQTSSHGLVRPYAHPSNPEPSQGRRKRKKIQTHSDGQRVRFFPDDDNRDLKQMFETEKWRSCDEDKALFLKMSSKRAGIDSDEEDAAFADAARISESAGKSQQRERDQAIYATQQRQRKLDGCCWCFGNEKQSKNLLVSLGQKCYLCLPVAPLTPNHCLLVPFEHCVSGTQLDEDIWEEMHNFRKSLVAMAKASGQYAIFFEDVRGLKKHPHMLLHCILLDKVDGELAPIYFKKALLDSEGEWTTNKKVADIKGNDIRGTIPKGLPYFSVEFPPEKGFAHVIENEDRFPSNFAQSVIGGMLDLDHRLWRHSKKNSASAQSQRERTIQFHRKFSKYDFTKTSKSSSDSSSSSSSDSCSSE